MGVDIKAWKKILPIKSGPMKWDASGVWDEIRDSKGNERPRQLTPAPILPTAKGVDQDDGLWLRVSWEDWRHQEAHQWMPDVDARNPRNLEALSGAPIDPTCSRQIAKWMAYASRHLSTENVALATRLGWIDGKFVWTNHLCGREWVGPDVEASGDIKATADAVRMIAKLEGDAGCLALTVLGMSAASPLVRWGCTRNPILGLAQSSSKGKSTVLALALSFWGNPSTWSLQGGSTVKGAQDLATQFPDTPILLEDLHKLHADRPDMVQDLLYYCGNGQRRITSSRAQTAKGGETRKGVAFYASEYEILGGNMGGVVYRTWELSGHPMPDGATARAVAAATQSGRGAAGPRLAEFYSTYSPDHWTRLLSTDYRGGSGVAIDTASLSTGDIPAVRCLAHGLAALRLVTGVMELDPYRVCDWLIRQIGEKRTTQVDLIQAGWEALIQAVLGGSWGKQVTDNGDLRTLDENRLTINNEVIAWRIPGMDEESWEALRINISSTYAGRILSRFGGERMLIKAWAEREYIERNGTHLKWLEGKHGRVAMRVSRAQLAHWTGPRPGDLQPDERPEPLPSEPQPVERQRAFELL